MQIRNPHVSGSFYPSDASELRQYFETTLKPKDALREAKAVVMPHAGYRYSGEVGCQVLSEVRVPQNILLIGPNHRGVGADFAIFDQGEWETPLGRVSIATKIAKKLLQEIPSCVSDSLAHQAEHSLEVLVPFLQFQKPDCHIIPLLIGTLNLSDLSETAIRLGDTLQNSAEPVLVMVSTDMSHYDSDEVTRKKDRYAIDAILNLDPEGLIRAAQVHHVTMCGLAPVYMLLVMKEALNIQKVSLVDYRTSADASGDKERVVGYAGFIFE